MDVKIPEFMKLFKEKQKPPEALFERVHLDLPRCFRKSLLSDTIVFTGRISNKIIP